jgi:hypothetical protein
VYQDIWYRYTASCPGTAMVSITNATFIPMLAAYAGQSCPPGALLSCSPTGSGMISFPVTAGGVYTIRVGGLIAQTGTGTLTLTPPSGSGPTINQQPQNQTPCPSSPASFSVAATGPGTITYQWRFNSSNIPGATQSTYNIASAGPANVGSYACQVTGACGSTLSNSASLTLGAAPVITQQPAYAAVPQGSPASFSVAATGTGLTYQWRRNGTPLANGGRVSGATSPTLQISQVIASDDGRYDVAITGSCGGATSNPAFLCYPNCDLSAVQPILNVSDFICFQNRFSAGDAYANCDGSTVPPILNVSDFICFSSRYAGGCP